MNISLNNSLNQQEKLLNITEQKLNYLAKDKKVLAEVDVKNHVYLKVQAKRDLLFLQPVPVSWIARKLTFSSERMLDEVSNYFQEMYDLSLPSREYAEALNGHSFPFIEQLEEKLIKEKEEIEQKIQEIKKKENDRKKAEEAKVWESNLKDIELNPPSEIEQTWLEKIETYKDDPDNLFTLIKDQFYFDKEDPSQLHLNIDLPKLLIFNPETIGINPYSRGWTRDSVTDEWIEHPSPRYQRIYNLLVHQYFHSSLPAEDRFNLYQNLALPIADFCHERFSGKEEVKKLYYKWINRKDTLSQAIEVRGKEDIEGVHLKTLSNQLDSPIAVLVDKIIHEGDQDPFTYPGFFEYLAHHPEEAEKIFIRFYSSVCRTSTHEIKKLKQHLNQVVATYTKTESDRNKEVQKYFAFLLNPGILKEKDRLLQFISDNGVKYKKEEISFDDLFQEITKHYGYQEYYRAMVLSEEELASITKEGILSLPALRGLSQSSMNQLFSLSNVIHPLSMTLFKHFHGRFLGGKIPEIYRKSELISISNYPEISKCVGQSLSGRVTSNGSLKNPDDALYLFKLNLPHLRVFPSKTDHYTFPAFIDYQGDHNVDKGFFVLQGSDDIETKEIKITDPGVENFVWHKIKPSEILEIKKFQENYSYKVVYRGESSPFGDYA